MKTRLAIVGTLLLALSGCATMENRKQDFPDSSLLLTTPCPALDLVPVKTTELSKLEKVVAENYTKYHQCASQVNGWIEWYNKEKENYEAIGTK